MKTMIVALSAVAMATTVGAQAQESQKKSVAVTVYNNNLGVVKDKRTVSIPSGTSQLKIVDVAQLIDPTSVHIELNGSVLEQNYQYDLVSLDKILQKYIDREITLVSETNERITGKLLSVTGFQIVLQRSEGGLLMLPNIDKYRLSVESLPSGLMTRPTLVWTVNSSKSGSQDVEVSYQTGGMNWHAEYVAVLNENDTKMDLNSWVSVENNSGATYENAVLKLVAGDVNRVQPPAAGNYRFKAMEMEAADDAMVAAQFQEKSFFEYHIYNLQRPTTIANNETKQISLFEASSVGVTKKYLYRSGGYYPMYRYGNSGGSKVGVVVEFENKEGNKLGKPMPAGKVRLYKSDGSSMEFVGEDMIDHTPREEKVSLRIGDAFDIVVEEQMTDSKRISDRVNEATYKIILKNRKDADVVVDVERDLGLNWEILSKTHSFEKKNATTALFRIPVAKGKETTLEFTVRTTY